MVSWMLVLSLALCGLRSFKHVCAAIQWGQISSFLSEASSSSLYYVSEQRRLWRNCADAQARLSLRCSHMYQVPFSHEQAPLMLQIPTVMTKQFSHSKKQPYRNDPKFSDRQVWANSADPDQTRSSRIRVYTVCHSVCISWTHYCPVKPPCSNFGIITANFTGVQIFRIFTVIIIKFKQRGFITEY